MEFLRNNARRVVVKIGTNTLTTKGQSIQTAQLAAICSQIAALRELHLDVVIVSSGAIGLGMGRLKLARRPTDLPTLQACAAIGQPLLMSTWQTALEAHGIQCAQVLLTREDVRGRNRHVAVRNTLERLLNLGVVPIINENDTVSADEIKFGDNDVLSALTASLIQADLLVILSTIPGLMDIKGSGEVVSLIEEITPAIRAMAGGTDSPTAVGGMTTKIDAAAIAIQSGCGVFIGNGASPTILTDLASGQAIGTFFLPNKIPLAARKRWIAFFERPLGTLHIDSGAAEAIQLKGRSLLAKGITQCEGTFDAGAVVNVSHPGQKPLARGIAHFSSADIQRIAGKDTDAIRQLLPGMKRYEVIHRDALVLLA